MIQYIGKTWRYADIAGYTDPGWYFWDETEAHCYGPFSSEQQAIDEAQKYAGWISQPKIPEKDK